jgi:hypothetical protein
MGAVTLALDADCCAGNEGKGRPDADPLRYREREELGKRPSGGGTLSVAGASSAPAATSRVLNKAASEADVHRGRERQRGGIPAPS